MALRFDAIRLDASKITRNPSTGAVRVPALITRSGVFPYQDANGKTILEWRPPAEVLKADSVAAFKDLPVTEKHPKGFVTADSWKASSIGHVSGDPRIDTNLQGIETDLVISDGRSIPKVGKALLEASCGYSCEIDNTPGVVPEGMPDAGKRYDRSQTQIVPNHVALGPANWGRQGNAVAMRLDSNDDQIVDEPQPTVETAKMKIRHDGKTFEAATEAELQALIDAHDAAKGTTDLTAQLAAERGRADAATAKAEALATQVAQEKARADAAPELAKQAAEARASLEVLAVKALGKTEKFDGKTDREVKVLVCKHFDSAFSDVEKVDGKDTPKSDAYVQGSFDVWTKAAPTRNDASTNRMATRLNGSDGSGNRSDDRETKAEEKTDANDPDPDAARKRMYDRNLSAHERADAGQVKKYINGQEVNFQG